VLCLPALLVGPSTSAQAPGLHREVADYLASRSGVVSVAVYDLVRARGWDWHSRYRGYTASIVKVDILAALLYREGRLSQWQRTLAALMIEESDNDAASTLYGYIGGAAGLDEFNRRAGLDQTVASSSWGLTKTSAHDQVQLLRLLASPGQMFTRAQRAYALGLMRSVVGSQCWGVAAGVPDGVSVALKNGWLPLSAARGAGWQMNSIGYVLGLGRRYLVGILSHSPGYAYGVRTIEHVSRVVWRGMSRSGEDVGSSVVLP
jgi:hypothetical protein